MRYLKRSLNYIHFQIENDKDIKVIPILWNNQIFERLLLHIASIKGLPVDSVYKELQHSSKDEIISKYPQEYLDVLCIFQSWFNLDENALPDPEFEEKNFEGLKEEEQKEEEQKPKKSKK
jgi:hypothetical protein